MFMTFIQKNRKHIHMAMPIYLFWSKVAHFAIKFPMFINFLNFKSSIINIHIPPIIKTLVVAEVVKLVFHIGKPLQNKRVFKCSNSMFQRVGTFSSAKRKKEKKKSRCIHGDRFVSIYSFFPVFFDTSLPLPLFSFLISFFLRKFVIIESYTKKLSYTTP